VSYQVLSQEIKGRVTDLGHRVESTPGVEEDIPVFVRVDGVIACDCVNHPVQLVDEDVGLGEEKHQEGCILNYPFSAMTIIN